MKGAMMESDSLDPLAQPLAETLAMSVQLRLMFAALRGRLAESAQIDFLAVEQRLLDLEIQLRKLNLQHPISAATISGPSARTIH